MTEIVLAAALLIAVVALAIAWRGTSKPATGSDVGHALRELLLARAEGRVSAEEFDQRQAALHASTVAAFSAAHFCLHASRPEAVRSAASSALPTDEPV